MLFQLKADCHLINIHFGLTRKFFEDLFDPDESSVDLKNLESLIESEYKLVTRITAMYVRRSSLMMAGVISVM